MLEFTIKNMSEEHLDEVADLEKMCFSVPWSLLSLKQSLNNDLTHFFVAVDQNERLLGYIGFYVACQEGYITNVAVAPQFRKLGIAKSLLNTAINFGYQNNLDFLSLEVRASNSAAISLYKSVDFLKVGIRKNFYSFPKEDAFIMTKYLK